MFAVKIKLGGFLLSLKQKVGMGVVTASLGLSLTFGGVFAYFSDSETSGNSFQDV
ncbi:Camelysin (Casein-cleaving metalloproteinase) [Bacillus mycoides]|nr:Camelysin (Casein-cleaving metalloproteinase) [Bacillus mycoides]